MNPDDLLAQIRDLLEQYLSLGQGTPVEAEAQALAAAIDQSMGGGGDQYGGGEMPPAPDEAPMTSGQTAVPDMTGGMPLDQQQSQDFTNFGDARAALEEAMRKKIKAPS